MGENSWKSAQRPRLTWVAYVVSFLWGFVALGGGGYAALLLTANALSKHQWHAYLAEHPADGRVTEAELASVNADAALALSALVLVFGASLAVTWRWPRPLRLELIAILALASLPGLGLGLISALIAALFFKGVA